MARPENNRKLDPESGRLLPNAGQAKLIEWLVTPQPMRSPKTLTALAAEIGVRPETLGAWKRDKHFREELDLRYSELNINPERIQDVVDAMHAKARNGDVQAAKLYLEYTKQYMPTTKVISDRGLDSMSDDELAALAEANVIALRSAS